MSLTWRQAVALAGKLYRAWVSGEGKERTWAVIHTPQAFVPYPAGLDEEEDEAAFLAISARLENARSSGGEADLEPTLGPIVSRLLLSHGIAEVDPPSRTLLLLAFADALRDAFLTRARNAAGDYSPDPKSERFPAWEPLETKPALAPPPAGAVFLKQLVEDWWKEAKATGRKPSTYESYSNTMAGFVAYLGHDDAGRVTPENVIGFKDHPLASISPRTKKPISPKTIKDSDLAGLKTVFGWAVSNRRMASNPIDLKVGESRS